MSYYNTILPSRHNVSEKFDPSGIPPLSELFNSQFFDTTLFNGGEYVLEDPSCQDSSQPGTIVEEILDFFVDPSNPSHLVMSRSAVPTPTPVYSNSAPKTSLSRKRQHEDESMASKRERNRLAAERCRAKRASLISALQSEVDKLKQEKERLQLENKVLLDTIARSGVEFSERAAFGN